jgi:dihydroorotase
MPNTLPPITSADMAVEYRKNLESMDPSITYLMTLYLNPSLTPEEVVKAKSMGVTGK